MELWSGWGGHGEVLVEFLAWEVWRIERESGLQLKMVMAAWQAMAMGEDN